MADYVKIHPTLPMPELSLDIGFASDPDDDTPTWTSVSSRVREIRCRVYRQTELDTFETGSLTCILDNRDRELEPFFAASSLSPNVLPRKRILYQVRHDSVEYPRFLGFIRQIRAYWPNQVDGVVEIVAEDYGLVLQRAQVTIDGYPEELVHERLSRVCDAVGIPAGDRDFDTSDHTCAAVPAQAANAEPRTVGALEHCKQAARSDGGYFFVARDGKLVFHNRRRRMDTFATSQGTLGDGDGEIPYSPSLVAQTDDATLVNRVALLTADGTREEHRDMTSADAFWDSRRDDVETLLAYPGQAFAGASLLVWRYKEPRPRFPSAEMLLSERERMTTADIATLLSCDVGTRLTVKRRPAAGGAAMEQEVHCEGFEEDAFPGQSYRLAVSISPADPEIDEWIVGTSELGVDTVVGV